MVIRLQTKRGENKTKLCAQALPTERVDNLHSTCTYSAKQGGGLAKTETAWSARTFMAFTTQRLSVAVQYSAAQEVAEALGLSVAADPRAAP